MPILALHVLIIAHTTHSPSWVRERFTEIANHERTHVEFLTTALKAAGATPVQECTYDFGTSSPEVFLATSQILEGVGEYHLHPLASLLLDDC